MDQRTFQSKRARIFLVLLVTLPFALEPGAAGAPYGSRPNGWPAVAQTTGTSHANGACRKVASPRGNDRSPGTLKQPYRTVQRLANALLAGETGCLRGGRYVEREVTLHVARTRLTRYRGERVSLVGRLRVTGDGVVVERLVLDGRNPSNLPSPTINADDVVFRDNDVSSRGSGICFILGSGGEIQRPLIKRNRIHDCGDELTEHGIYMQNVDYARIVGNTIYDNADRGIKIGPDAQYSLIRANVIDGNAIGLNFSGGRRRASSYNLVERNVIAYSTRWWNVQTYWRGDFVGQGNEVRFNCVHAANADPRYNANGGINGGRGYSAQDNLVAEPRYVNRAAKDFRLRSDSPCRNVYEPSR